MENYVCFGVYQSSLIVRVKGYGVYRHFQQYFSYIMAVSFIGGGYWRTRIFFKN
jgi:hypothetical protein